MSLMGAPDAAELNTVVQKYLSTMSKLRSAEDKVVKAMQTYTEPESESSSEPSRTNLVLTSCMQQRIEICRIIVN